MAVDPSFVQLNRASTERLRNLVNKLSDADLVRPVYDGWSVAAVLAHIALWDQRAIYMLDRSERERTFINADLDRLVNDVVLPLLSAIPPHEAARIAVQTAAALDRRLETISETLREQINDYNPRWVNRSLHRNEHLNDVDGALKRFIVHRSSMH